MGLTNCDHLPEDPDNHLKELCWAAFKNIVKPGLWNQFQQEAGSWFVLEQTVEKKREPGLLKPEFVTSNGAYVGLCPKSYMVTNYNDGKSDIKKGTKGDLK